MSNYEKVVWLRYQQYKYETNNFVTTYEEFLVAHIIIDMAFDDILGFSTVDLLKKE